MEKFTITDEGINRLRVNVLKRILPGTIMAMIAGILVTYLNTDSIEAFKESNKYFIPLLIVLLLISINRSMNRVTRAFESYRLIIDETEIRREQENVETLKIQKSEITSIIKNRNGSITVIGNSKLNAIAIPGEIEKIKRVEELLSSILPVNSNYRISFFQRFQLILSFIFIGCFLATLTSHDKIIVGLCGTISLLMLSYSMYVIQKSKNIQRRTKRSSWFLILIFIVIIVQMTVKIGSVNIN